MNIPDGTVWNNVQALDMPERTIVALVEVENPLQDAEPYAQCGLLSCGHWFISSFGIFGTEYRLGNVIRCDRCWRHVPLRTTDWAWSVVPRFNPRGPIVWSHTALTTSKTVGAAEV